MMIDWNEAAQHAAALEIGPDEGLQLALFPPKGRTTNDGCFYITVSPGSNWKPENVEAELQRRPGYALGAIFNPGGTKNTDIKFCRFLMFEDDGEGGLDEKKNQWETAGLLRPSFQIWTGGKSVHHYYLLEEPCTPDMYRRGMKRLSRHCKKTLGAGIDSALCNPARILRMAGGVHPSTGEMARYISAGGQKYSYEQLWNLTGDDSYAISNLVTEFYAKPSRPTPAPTQQAPKEGLQELPDYDDPEHKEFRKQQVINDQEHRPEKSALRAFPRTEQLRLITDALPFCIDRGPAGSGTYPVAFKILASIVNNYGANDALQCCVDAGWGQSNWDLTAEVYKIQENSSDRDDTMRVTIFHLFDSAEFNGWIRPWKITKENKGEVLDPEEQAEVRAFKRVKLQEWMESRASQFTLADSLPADIALILSKRADAFPVSEVAMLPPFIAAMASVMGTRYQVQIKKGWKEPMVFWFGSVGPASSLKTPVANQILWPLLQLDHKGQTEYKKALKEYKAGGGEGAAPELPRKRVAGDATLEGLTAALDNESNYGMLCHHDELVSFIASMDAYRGRSGPSKDRAHWLSMWSGQEINILRKGHQPIFIPKTAVSVFGAVQQDKLTELLHGDDATAKGGDGFWARFLWCVPCNPRPLMNRDETEINLELAEMCAAFDSLGKQDVTVHLGDDAWGLFATQCDLWSAEADNTYAARSAFLGKIRGYAARFAGFLHALDYVNRIRDTNVGGALHQIEREISGDTMKRALLLAQFFINQFDVLAPQVGGHDDLPAWVVKIVELAGSRDDNKVTVADLRQRKWGESTTERKGMLNSLVTEYGLGRMIQAPRANQVWWQLT